MAENDDNSNDGNENGRFAKEYSDESFWAKVGKYALVAGKQVIGKALTLYACLKDKDTPAWARAVIVTALGYFILPMDAIPDMTPAAGYSDDLGALAAALSVVAVHIKPEHQEWAKEKMRQWFGRSDEKEEDHE